MGRSLSEESVSIHAEIWNYFLAYFFFTLLVMFFFLGFHFKPYKFLMDFRIWIHTSFIPIVYFIFRCVRKSFLSFWDLIFIAKCVSKLT